MPHAPTTTDMNIPSLSPTQQGEATSASAITPEELASIASIPLEQTGVASIPKSREELNREYSDDTSGVTKLPSLTSVMARRIGESPAFDGTRYAEENDARFLNNALNKGSVIKGKLQNLGNEVPEKRAQIGSRIGAGIGLAVDGPVGSVIGAGLGAMATRGMGLVQSGEHEDARRQAKILETMKTMGVTSDNNRIDFDDASSFLITTDPGARLRNVSSVFGEADRSLFEIDKTNPFSKRAVTVARPIARFLAGGILGFKDTKNPRDLKALDNATTLFANALQTDANSIDTVYNRAVQLAGKFGITERGIRTYFDANKMNIDPNEAKEIRQGLDIIYA